MSNNDQEIVDRLKSQSFRGIIFDFDGTLLDIKNPLERAIEETFKEKNIPFEMEKTLQEIGSTLESIQGYPIPKILLQSYEIFENLTVFNKLTFLKKLRIAMKIFSRYQEYSKDAQFFPGIKDLLTFLNKNANLFIVSHNQTKKVLEFLKRDELESYFKAVYGADMLPALKPHPDAFLPLLEQYKKIKNNDWLIIGDMPSDIEAGKEAGLFTMGIASGISKKEVLANLRPNLLINSITELLDKLGIKSSSVSNSNVKTSLKVKS